jgi:hypothetical protein
MRDTRCGIRDPGFKARISYPATRIPHPHFTFSMSPGFHVFAKRGFPWPYRRKSSHAGRAQDGQVIENFKHKGLAQFFEDDDHRKLPASQIDKIRRILARLN